MTASKPVKWTEQRIEMFRAMADQGDTLDKIAARFGISEKYAGNLCAKWDVMVRGRRRNYRARNGKLRDVNIRMSPPLWEALKTEAYIRKFSGAQLVSEIISAVISDNLIDAVIDGDRS